MSQLAAVLLVDDDPSTNFLNEAALYSMRLTETYLTAHDGTEALEMLRLQAPHATPERPVLVLLDMAMPVMGGMGFLEAFSTLPKAVQDATVIVILAVSMAAADMERISDYPVAGTISKPLTSSKLSTILQLRFNAR